MITAEDCQYLVNTTHYDYEDGGNVFKCLEVVEEGFDTLPNPEVVVYRAQMLPNGEWLELWNDPIFIL